MAAVAWVRPKDLLPAQPEQRMVIRGVSWQDYVILREALDTPGLRMTYCEGLLELMSPSRNHELWKKTTARLIEVYAFLLRLPLVGYGSTTFRSEARERGVEPHECWRVGTLMKDGEIPDIALEVIYTSPILDKLHVYDGLRFLKSGSGRITLSSSMGGKGRAATRGWSAARSCPTSTLLFSRASSSGRTKTWRCTSLRTSCAAGNPRATFARNCESATVSRLSFVVSDVRQYVQR